MHTIIGKEAIIGIGENGKVLLMLKTPVKCGGCGRMACFFHKDPMGPSRCTSCESEAITKAAFEGT